MLMFISNILPVVLMILREPKRTRKVSELMWQTWINSRGDFKEIFCDIYLELPLFNTTKPYER